MEEHERNTACLQSLNVLKMSWTCLNNQPSLRVANPVATATAMIPGVCDLSALSEDTGNYPNCLVKNKTAPPNKQKTKNIFRLFKAHSESQRLWDFGSKVFIYHRLSYLCVRVWSCMHLCICGHWRLAIRDRTPHSITGNDHKAVLNKIETHTHTNSADTHTVKLH